MHRKLKVEVQIEVTSSGPKSIPIAVSGGRVAAAAQEPAKDRRVPSDRRREQQGVLDEQFLQLQQLQDETSPNFVSEVVNIYFHESEKLLRNLRALLMEREFSDYKKMGIHLNQFMGSSSSIGAKRVRNVCVAFRAATEQNNRAGCLRALEMLEHEYCYLKNKLHELFQGIEKRDHRVCCFGFSSVHHAITLCFAVTLFTFLTKVDQIYSNLPAVTIYSSYNLCHRRVFALATEIWN
ncbi:hypothetical protein Fmac_012602 [Flemingia macrophylla]|uniref:Histidine-containing phosphotransfer protein n=1 Tax=Flemingia macrophylla TaxID=520843 RepID=A0ABD1MQS4_9FABA